MQMHTLIEDFNYKLAHRTAPKFHTHPKYEIYYFHSGKCQYMLGGETITLVPGDLIAMSGIREHGPIMDDSETYIRSTILFDSASLQTYQAQLGQVDAVKPFRMSPYVHWRLNGSEKLEWEELLRRIDQFYTRRDTISQERLNLAFLDALLFIAGKYEESGQRKAKSSLSDKEKIVWKVMAYIEEQYMNELTVDTLARAVPVSRYYLMKLFKEHTGMTVFDYINLRRINQAKVLFFLRAYNVTEVGEQVGFKHLSHFSRNFKKLTGVSPDEYRRFVHSEWVDQSATPRHK